MYNLHGQILKLLEGKGVKFTPDFLYLDTHVSGTFNNGVHITISQKAPDEVDPKVTIKLVREGTPLEWTTRTPLERSLLEGSLFSLCDAAKKYYLGSVLRTLEEANWETEVGKLTQAPYSTCYVLKTLKETITIIPIRRGSKVLIDQEGTLVCSMHTSSDLLNKVAEHSRKEIMSTMNSMLSGV